MRREVLSVLSLLLLSAPSFCAPVEIARLRLEPSVVSAPTGVSASAIGAPALRASLIPTAAPVSAAAAAMPSAAPAPVPSAARAAFAAPAAAALPSWTHPSAPVRGPPAAVSLVARTVESWGVPVESILEDRDVLLVGENHGSLESVAMLAREMPRLARAGVTVVGIEGFKRPHQAEVDAWLSGRREDLPESALDFSPRRREAFRELFESARREGVRLVALGVPLDRWARAASRLAAKRLGGSVDDFPRDVEAHFERAGDGYEEGYNESVAEVFLTRRNRAMAAFLAASLRDGGKAVVLAGQAHVEGLDMVPGRLLNAPGDWGTLARELGRRALNSFSLTQTGGRFVSPDAAQLDRAARPKSYHLSADMAPDGRPRYVPLGADRGLWYAGASGGAPALRRHASASDAPDAPPAQGAFQVVQLLQSIIFDVIARRTGHDALTMSLGLSAVGGLSVADYLAMHKGLAGIDATGQELADAVDRVLSNLTTLKGPMAEGGRIDPEDLASLRLYLLDIPSEVVVMRNGRYLGWRARWAAGKASADFSTAALAKTEDGWMVRLGGDGQGVPLIVHFDKSVLVPAEIAKHMDALLGSRALAERDRASLRGLAAVMEAQGLLPAGYDGPALAR